MPNLGDTEVGGAGGGGAGFRVVALDHVEGDAGAADPFDGEGDGGRFEVRAAGVDVRGIAKAELDVDRRRATHQAGDLVVADEAAEVVGRLHVDVQREGDRLPDGRHLREAEVHGDVERTGANLLPEPCRGGVGGGQLDAGLDYQVGRQRARALHLRRHPEEAGVGDKDAAQPEIAAAADVLDGVDQ